MSPLIDRETITGSLPPKLAPSIPLAPGLDAEDKRLANAALAAALDPAANGKIIEWENPRNNIKGSFTATGKAASARGHTCATFNADIIQEHVPHTLSGRACAQHLNDWTVVEIKKRDNA